MSAKANATDKKAERTLFWAFWSSALLPTARTRTSWKLPSSVTPCWPTSHWHQPNRTCREKANIASLKNGRCQGTDNIHSEQLKYSTSEILLKYKILLMQMIWSCLVVPANSLTASITCLHKRGLRSLSENYRGLSISATVFKVMPGIVINRLRRRMKKSCYQRNLDFGQTSHPLVPYLSYVMSLNSQRNQIHQSL